MTKILFSFIVCSVVLLMNCDDEIIPLSGDVAGLYSAYGYLDTEADTQWVRVMPVRESLDAVVDSIRATVTLSEVGGLSEVMNPRVHNITNEVGDTVKIWNFWTTLDIQPDSEYEFRIVDEVGTETYAIVITPSDFEPPVVSGNNVEFNYLENLGDVRLQLTLRNNITGEIRDFSYSHLSDVWVNTQGFSTVPVSHEVSINPNIDFLIAAAYMGYIGPDDAYDAHFYGDLEIIHSEVLVVKAREEWVDFYGLSVEEMALQSSRANVENGIGYIVGAIVKVVEYNVCIGDVGEAIACNG